MVIAFNTKHLDEMELTEERMDIIKRARDHFLILSRINLASTSVSKDRTVLGVLGAVVMGEGECEVFIIPSETRKSYAVTFLRDVRQELERMKGQFCKIRAMGVDSPFFTRWFTNLGFALEGPVTRAGDEGKLMWVMDGKGGKV
ncbi:MAG: hypothetical protein V4510_13485 [bacterium]